MWALTSIYLFYNVNVQKMKTTVAEVVVPAVLRLYSRLAPKGGQVPAYLVRIANDLLNDYRQEVTNTTSMIDDSIIIVWISLDQII